MDGLPADGDDVRLAHLLPGDGLPCQRVLGQREHVDRRFKKQLARHARFQITGRAVAEVGAAVHHGLLDPGHGQIHELDPHLRIPAHEAVGQQRDQRTAQKRRRRDAYPVDAGIVQFRGALFHAAEHVLGPAGLFEKYLARRRQFDDSPPSVKKLDAYLVFQILDQVADRALRDVQRRTGRREAAELCDHQKGIYLTNGDIHSSSRAAGGFVTDA